MKQTPVLKWLLWYVAVPCVPVFALETQGVVLFQRAGTYEWVVPEGVDAVHVELVGAGGSGGTVHIEEVWGPEKRETLPYKRVFRRDDPDIFDPISSHIINGPVRIRCANCYSWYHGTEMRGATCGDRHLTVNNPAMVVDEQDSVTCLGDRYWQYREEPADIVTQRLEHRTIQENGGASGQVVIQELLGLHEGDSLSIHVGASSPSGDGAATTVTVNGHTYGAKGGRHGGAVDIHGERGSAPSSSLLGMGGRASTVPGMEGETGFDGAVTLTYVRPENIYLKLLLRKEFAGRLCRFVYGQAPEDYAIGYTLQKARKLNPALGQHYEAIKASRVAIEASSTILAKEMQAFDELFFQTVVQHPVLVDALLLEESVEKAGL